MLKKHIVEAAGASKLKGKNVKTQKGKVRLGKRDAKAFKERTTAN